MDCFGRNPRSMENCHCFPLAGQRMCVDAVSRQAHQDLATACSRRFLSWSSSSRSFPTSRVSMRTYGRPNNLGSQILRQRSTTRLHQEQHRVVSISAKENDVVRHGDKLPYHEPRKTTEARRNRTRKLSSGAEINSP